MVRAHAAPAQPDTKEAVLGLLSDLLEEGLLVVGFPRGRLGFVPWEAAPADAIGRIRRE